MEQLIKEVKKDLDKCEILPLSLSEKAETVRMNVLPGLLLLSSHCKLQHLYLA